MKLVFNPASGVPGRSPVQLMDILAQLQAWRFLPEVFIVEPGCDIPGMVRESLGRHVGLFAVCGGDGTVSAVARELMGSSATLGVIPTGTQNNIALSLGIPLDIAAAIAALRMGRRVKADMGIVSAAGRELPFLEVCSAGLMSALLEAGDELQHGKLSRIGDFLATLATFPPAEFRLLLDGEREIRETGHVVLIANMPTVCRRYRVGEAGAYRDGFFDVLFFSEHTKLDLVGAALTSRGRHLGDDPRVISFRAKRVELVTSPAMPLMADGLSMGEGNASFTLRRRALGVMAAGPGSGDE